MDNQGWGCRYRSPAPRTLDSPQAVTAAVSPVPRARWPRAPSPLAAALTAVGGQGPAAAEAARGRRGDGADGARVVLLGAARLDGAEVAVAPGSEVAGQRQVQHLRSRRLGLAVGGVADGLVLLPQLRLGCLHGDRGSPSQPPPAAALPFPPAPRPPATPAWSRSRQRDGRCSGQWSAVSGQWSVLLGHRVPGALC